MTDTTTSRTGHIERVDPTTLTVGDNVREDVQVDAEFVNGVKAIGILQPPTVTPNGNGGYEIVIGHRRTLAAIEAGLPQFDVYVVDKQGAAVARLLDQFAENEQRQQLTEAERAGGYKKLQLFGLSPAQIARKTSTAKKRVEAALAVAASPTSLAALESGNVTLDQAAAILEFDDDAEVSAELTKLALEKPDYLDHAIATRRTARAQKAAHDALAAELTAAGYEISEEEFRESNATVAGIGYLYTDAERTKPLANNNTDRITPFPGLKAVIRNEHVYDEKKSRYVIVPVAGFFVDGWQDLGYFADSYLTRKTAAAASGGGLTEEQKAERALTRTNNKLWVPATEVRLAFIKELLQRKDLPSGWEMWVARFIARSGAESNYTFALRLLEASTRSDEWLDKNPTRAPHFMIASAIASIEGAYEFGKSGWRNTLAPAYLTQLSKWGYTLSDLEETVAKKATK